MQIIKKYLLVIMSFVSLVCAGCTFNNTKESGLVDWDRVVENLKTQSSECRKVHLVGVPFIRAYEYMKKGEEDKGLLALCVSYSSYKMSNTEINAMVEKPDGTALATRMSDIADRCVEATSDKGKKAWEYASLADEKLTPYMQKHFDECLKLPTSIQNHP